MTTPLYARRETAHHICAYMGQKSPLLSCRLYHKRRRHESWQGLAVGWLPAWAFSVIQNVVIMLVSGARRTRAFLPVA